MWEVDVVFVDVICVWFIGFGLFMFDVIVVLFGLLFVLIVMVFVVLECEGYVMCGCFMLGVVMDEWCECYLFVCIYCYMVKWLCCEIELVECVDFMCFLFYW